MQASDRSVRYRQGGECGSKKQRGHRFVIVNPRIAYANYKGRKRELARRKPPEFGARGSP